MSTWSEQRSKPQYPSWPAPVVSLKCHGCMFTIILPKSGRAALSQARKEMREHVRQSHQVKGPTP